MSHFDAYRDSFPNAQLTRSKTGVLEVALHTKGGTLAFNGYTHEQFVDLFHAIASDRDNRVVILTGSGNAFMETISPEGFDFFTPQGYDKIYREGRKVLMNILDIEVPLIAAATSFSLAKSSMRRQRRIGGRSTKSFRRTSCFHAPARSRKGWPSCHRSLRSIRASG
jgi:hypothetical protein